MSHNRHTHSSASDPRRFRTLLALLAVAAGTLLALASSAAAAPGFLTSAPDDPAPGEAAEELSFPKGIVANPNLPGDVYVVDDNNRVNVFSPWGEFVKAFGWGVDSGAAAFETCTAASTCQKGIAGASAGQFNRPEAIAADSSGDIYVIESNNHRVQKFDSDGDFLLMFGDGVNATTGGDVCTASGDTCQAGTAGNGPGQLGHGIFGNGTPGYVGLLAVSPSDGSIFVGENERIQKFDPNGAYEETITLPAGKEIRAITASASKLYVSFVVSPSDPGKVIRTLEPSGPNAGFLEPSFTVPVEEFVTSLTPNPAGGLYATTGGRAFEFDPSGVVVSSFDLSSDASVLWGIGTGSACGPTDVYLAHFGGGVQQNNAYFNIFGAPPNPATCPPPASPPTISDPFVSSVSTEEAELKAKINPNFWADTTYYLEYGTAPCSAGGCDQEQPAAPGKTLTSQVIKTPFDAPVSLAGLEPNTTYHYRFVAQSSGGGPVRGPEGSFHTFAVPDPPNTACPNQAFRSFTPSEPLPDCRAYEMVSPLAKGGNDLDEPGTLTCFDCLARIDQATASGSALTYSAQRPFAEPGAGTWSSQYTAERDPANGWQTRSIAPPTSAVNYYLLQLETSFQAFSPDLCTAYYWQFADVALTPGDQHGYPDLYRVSTCEQPLGYQLLTSAAPIGNNPPANGQETYFPRVQGFSADGSIAVFRVNAKLIPNASSATGGANGPVYQIYLQDGKGLRLVSVLPDGSPAGTDSNVGAGDNSPVNFRADTLASATSADGSRVYWSSPVGANEHTKLYLRINADQAQSKFTPAGKCSEAAKACTLAVSGSVTSGEGAARFVAATADGSKALFYFASFGGGSHAGELYSYDLATQTSTLIAAGLQGDAPVLGASEDLSKIYFLSKQVLAPHASAAQSNLYLYEEGQGFTFIASGSSGGSEGQPYIANLRVDSGYPYDRPFRVSADGEYAVFVSKASLTGYDNTAGASGEPATEVYHYDASANGGAGQLLCVSCNPTGARPRTKKANTGSAGEFSYLAALIPGAEYSFHASRVLSADGNRVFFESFDALLPTDTSTAQDVYEWQATDTGECDPGDSNYFESNGGCLSLITSGQSPRDAAFIDASADGTDVFIKSDERLHGADTDTLRDIYDARENGGFPPPTPPQPPCDLGTGACEGAGSSPPHNTGAGSAVFQGPGNTTTTPQGCPKGKRKVTHRGKARCVAKAKPRHHKRAAKHERRTHR
ncbi:MAG TPA: hypothetical protein VN758_08345 [Solirubrobacterales bacterium]|nr:hypothetical protein [Solirubrobacterales bacterium]